MNSNLMMRKQNRSETKCMIAQWRIHHWQSVFFWNVLTESLAESSFCWGMRSVYILPFTCTITPLLQHQFSPCTRKCSEFSHLRKIKASLGPTVLSSHCPFLPPFAAVHLKALAYPLPPVLAPSWADLHQGLLHYNKTATSWVTYVA